MADILNDGSFTRLVSESARTIAQGPELPEEEVRELWKRIEGVNRRRSRRRISFMAAAVSVAAAVVLLLVLDLRRNPGEPVDYPAIIGSALRSVDNSEDVQLISSDAHYNTLVVPAGKRSVLTLADGTKLWVNSESTVVYSTRFDQGKREIFVDGEIYLDVFHNERIPFVVKTGSADVKVLGTQFNVLSRVSRSILEVVLVSGRVEVTTEDNSSAILAPDELYRYDLSTGRSTLSKVDVADHVAWRERYYRFDNQPLDIVLRKISGYYGIPIEWDDSVSALTCSGKLDLRDDPAEVLSMLTLAAPIVVREKEGEYTVKVKP